MSAIFESIATNAGNGLINSFFGDYARGQNFKYNERAAENADKRYRSLYNDIFSWGAQLKQIQEAGLSPSLMLGGASGSGGVSAPQGAGTGGVQPGYSITSPAELAQVNLLEEEERGLRIENDNKQEAIEADIALKLSQAGLNKASQAYTETQNIRGQIAARIEGATEGIEIEKVMSEADLMYWEAFKCQYDAKSSQKQYDFDVETYSTRVKSVAAEYSKLLTDIKEGNSRIQLNQATIEKMAADIATNWFNAKVGYMSYAAQEKWYRDQIEVQLNKLEQDKLLTKEQFEIMKRGQWMNFATDVIGSICNIGAAATKALIPIK